MGPDIAVSDSGEMTLKHFNIPNSLTTLRIILVPVFVSALVYKKYDYALYVFIVAAVTDFFDGLIARARNQQTALGKFLDPVADKFLLVTSFVLFAVYGLVPKWLTITVISRDIIIVTGWLILYLTSHRTRVEPSLLGKLANASQLILLVYILLRVNLDRDVLPAPEPLIIVTAVLTVLSGVHYIYRGLA
ncbi:MAG: CDP-diacylglycerol--glycerol-3-phosphate 3-phosphatidyltransferase [Nitrospirota bacterium]|nr:CDP-diacylglycerol--glycerol-3-phosphate 3-phosphatidyltransferase [Nitrospirota bacterium]